MPLAHRDAQLAPREVRAEAPVHTTAERQVAVLRAVEAHVEGVVELAGVEVGRAEVDRARTSPAFTGQPPSSVSTVAMRNTFGTGVSQRNSSSIARGDDRRVVDDLTPVLGVLGQEREQARERVGHGVEPGDEEEEADVEDLFARQLLAVDLDA